MVETVVFSDELLLSISSLVVESASFSDEIVSTRHFDIEETAVFHDALVQAGTIANNVIERAQFSEALEISVTDLVAETAVFHDVNVLIPSAHVEETAVFHDVLTQAITGLNTVVAETAVFSDSLQVGIVSTLAETVVFSDVLPTFAVLSNDLQETAVFSDAQALVTSPSSMVEELAVFDDMVISVLSAISLLEETAYFSDVTQGGGGAGAWHTHLEKFAMTRYSNFGFQSMAVVGGVLIGITEDGVYSLDADADDGADIQASIVHDWLDGDDPRFKRPRYLYLQGTTPGQMSVRLGYHDSDGNETISPDYDTPVGSALGLANTRASLGRGIRSRYLQPTLSNVGGAPFVTNDATLVVDVIARKI